VEVLLERLQRHNGLEVLAVERLLEQETQSQLHQRVIQLILYDMLEHVT
jgi:hypothetical protein